MNKNDCPWWRGHDWSKWGEPEEAEIVAVWRGIQIGEPYTMVVQRRQCQRCGEMEKKRL